MTGNSRVNPYKTMAAILRNEHNKGWHVKRTKTRCPLCQIEKSNSNESQT